MPLRRSTAPAAAKARTADRRNDSRSFRDGLRRATRRPNRPPRGEREQVKPASGEVQRHRKGQRRHEAAGSEHVHPRGFLLARDDVVHDGQIGPRQPPHAGNPIDGGRLADRPPARQADGGCRKPYACADEHESDRIGED